MEFPVIKSIKVMRLGYLDNWYHWYTSGKRLALTEIKQGRWNEAAERALDLFILNINKQSNKICTDQQRALNNNLIT